MGVYVFNTDFLFEQLIRDRPDLSRPRLNLAALFRKAELIP